MQKKSVHNAGTDKSGCKMENKFRGHSSYDGAYMRICARHTYIQLQYIEEHVNKRMCRNGEEAHAKQRLKNKMWKGKKMYEKRGRSENEKAERDETAEEAREEAASSRMQDTDGFTWLESARHRIIF